MDEYEKWAVYQYDWKKQRNASITELTFPFSYRPGQKELAAMVYHTVEKKESGCLLKHRRGREDD